ncbi:MAG: hypothetical protein RIQ56_935 [Candidatus Parcubacteria bacterium]|jgi:hypothetical protein
MSLETTLLVYGCGLPFGFVTGLLFRWVRAKCGKDVFPTMDAFTFALASSSAWPVGIPLILHTLQDEFGFFHRPPGWKPQREHILDVLEGVNGAMTPYEILKAGQGKISEPGLYVRLARLHADNLITTRMVFGGRRAYQLDTSKPRQELRTFNWRDMFR